MIGRARIFSELTVLAIVAFALGFVFTPRKMILPAIPVYPDDRAAAALLQIVPDIDLDGLTTEQAIDRIREITGSNLFIAWDQASTIRNRPLRTRVHLHGVSLAVVLDALCAAAGNPNLRLSAARNVIILSERYIPMLLPPTTRYPVRDLLDDPAKWAALLDPRRDPPRNVTEAREALVSLVSQKLRYGLYSQQPFEDDNLLVPASPHDQQQFANFIAVLRDIQKQPAE